MAGHPLEGLFTWLERPEWSSAFDELTKAHAVAIKRELGLSPEDLGDVLGEDGARTLFACVFEEFATIGDGVSIIDDYLKRRGFRETPSDRAYLRALRDSVMSLYEVSDVRPGESFLARDLVRGGDPVRVSEVSGSRELKQWDRLAARIVAVGRRWEMCGGVLPITRATSELVLEGVKDARKALIRRVRRAARKDGLSPPPGALAAMADEATVLRGLTSLFISAWLHDLMSLQEGPELRNYDGDPIAPTKLTWTLRSGATAADARAALSALAPLVHERGGSWGWIEPDAGTARAAHSRLDDAYTVIGRLELKNRKVVLSVNSAERATRGLELVGPALAALAGFPAIEAEAPDLDSLMPETDAKAAPIAPEELQAVMRDFQDRHYRAVLDAPVPMLGDKTPREAAKTAGGRKEVVAWLKQLENSSARSPGEPYDFGWVWEELGLGRLRQ